MIYGYTVPIGGAEKFISSNDFTNERIHLRKKYNSLTNFTKNISYIIQVADPEIDPCGSRFIGFITVRHLSNLKYLYLKENR